MQIVPAIDISNKKVVRLRQGDPTSVTAYGDDPLDFIRSYYEAGYRNLHLVDIDAALGESDLSLQSVVRQCTTQYPELNLQIGGGIRSLPQMQNLFAAGASKLVFGSLLFKDPAIVEEAMLLWGPERIIASLDVREEMVQISGWTEQTAFSIDRALLEVEKMGLSRVLITDIDRDGMACGPNIALYARLMSSFPTVLITASGGVRSSEDLRNLEDAGCSATVVGRAFLERTIPRIPRMPIRIIPCLDVADGRVVKGIGFQNLRDAGDPVECAQNYSSQGADELVFLDITATNENRSTQVDLVSRIADAINIPFTIGGGIRSICDAKELLAAGADKISINSAAVRSPSLIDDIASELGSANLVCAVDVKRVGDTWRVLINGGREDANCDALPWIEEVADRGAGELLITSYDRDGTGEGFDCEFLKEVRARVSIPIIASGGAGSLQNFVDGAAQADALLAASVFHFGTFSIADVKSALSFASYPVRL